MTKPSAFENERLNHINNLMDNINDSTSDIYEHLVDREFDKLLVCLNDLISQLEDIKNSLQDEP